jgi:hypothetical protein
VDRPKKAFRDDHLKNLLTNYVKKRAQVDPEVLVPICWDPANSPQQIRAGLPQTSTEKKRLMNNQRQAK